MNKQSAKQQQLKHDFSKGAKLNGATTLWIGVSDIGDEDTFTYKSDGVLVNFVCESSAAGRAGKGAFNSYVDRLLPL